MKGKIALINILFSVLFFTSCGSDSTDAPINNDTQNKIAQHWELSTAKRNGRKTETLVDAFLKLQPNGTGTINIDGLPQSANWSIDESNLVISNTKSEYLSTKYEISKFKDSLLVLNVKLKSTPFEMTFHVAATESEE